MCSRLRRLLSSCWMEMISVTHTGGCDCGSLSSCFDCWLRHCWINTRFSSSILFCISNSDCIWSCVTFFVCDESLCRVEFHVEAGGGNDWLHMTLHGTEDERICLDLFTWRGLLFRASSVNARDQSDSDPIEDEDMLEARAVPPSSSSSSSSVPSSWSCCLSLPTASSSPSSCSSSPSPSLPKQDDNILPVWVGHTVITGSSVKWKDSGTSAATSSSAISAPDSLLFK